MVQRKQRHVLKTIKDFRLIGPVAKNNNASNPLIYTKEVNHAGKEVIDEKKFVVKQDFYHRQNAYLEKMAYDLFSFLGVPVPKSYIVEDESANKLIASRIIPGYQDLSEYITTKEFDLGNQAKIIINQDKYNEIRDKGTLNGKSIRGFAEFNTIYFFCYDLDLLGSHYGNMGLIEYHDYYQAIKIDPSIFIKIECFFDFPDISYEQVLGYFFNFEYFHDLFKNASPEDNILAFQKIINISESQLYEIVFNPAFTSVEDKGELYIAPIPCFIKEDTLQKQMWVSLQHRKNIFNLVYSHFFPLYQAISKNEALDHCLELLLDASQQSEIPVLKAAVYSGDLNLIAHCIDNYPNEIVFNEKQNLLHLACELEFTELVAFLYNEKQDIFKSLNTSFPKTEFLGETFFYMLHLHTSEELELLKTGNLSKEQKKAVEYYNPCFAFTITRRKPLKLPYLKDHEFDASWMNIVYQAMELAVFEAKGKLGENESMKEKSLKQLSYEFKIKNWQSANEEIRLLLMDFWKILAAPTSIGFFKSEFGYTQPALVFKRYINENAPKALIDYISELTNFSLEVRKERVGRDSDSIASVLLP